MSGGGEIAEGLAHARRLAAKGDDEPAKAAYLDVLRRDPAHFAALNELGALAFGSGHRSAARSCYEQAVRSHPENPIGRVNLANLLYEEGDLAGARTQYEAALAADGEFAAAHQGLARVLSELGESEAAAPHWEKGFAGHAIVERPYRGTANPVRVLLLVSAKGGNVPTAQWLDDRIFAVAALYTEFSDEARVLPPHDVVLNAIGDADLCSEALTGAEAVLAHVTAPLINPPAQVRATGRVANARRFAGLPGVVAPVTVSLPRAAILAAKDWRFPLLLRAPGFHTGRHFLRVERAAELAAAVAALPGDELLAIQYLDARGADGKARKYRVMFVDGALYPLHLAVSADWKVHYFTADMAANSAYRAEEQHFLEAMPEVLGPQAFAALALIGKSLGLDYAGIDFGLAPDGRVLVFEANATMVVNPPDPDPIWDYRRLPIRRVLDAARRMLLKRAGT